ncbi:hypothetical protein [Litoribrevibacter albus]|uniref:Uncharacterized protein n=1 Tax=Litoribrevibacter albus TaxID=1473156 RepID=A0AA37W6J2_9GAMM|nr:hypothetical protein [Litoribrevibacter albus]GLQ32082.1 hypothetical protein GCM10007876_25610 [Litoribrevibacter albus]
MPINHVTGNNVNSSTQSPSKQNVDGLSKSKNGRQQGNEDQSNPYSDQVSISGRASQLERVSKELFSEMKAETQIGDLAHTLYEYGFLSLENLNHIPLETRTQKIETPEQAVNVLQGQAQELALQGEDSATLEGMNKLLTTLKNITAPSYPASAYQRATGYGYLGIQ